jgi:hypothetical protein
VPDVHDKRKGGEAGVVPLDHSAPTAAHLIRILIEGELEHLNKEKSKIENMRIVD